MPFTFGVKNRVSIPCVIRDDRARVAGTGAAGQRKLNAAVLVSFLAGVLAFAVSGCGVTIPGTNAASNTNSETLVISTQAVNFGSVIVGQTANATVSVTNTGTASFQIEQIQLQGAGFAVTGQNSTPVSVAAGDSYNLGLSFTPTSTGATTGALLLTSSVAPGRQWTIALSGTGESTAAAPAALDGLTCASASITGAGTDSCTVTLTAAAATGGLKVDLASSNAAVTAPAWVTVAAGATSVGFKATISAVTKAESATLTATADGVTKSETIQLKPPTAAPAALDGLTCASASITGAGTDSCTVTLTAAAATGGLKVDLASSSAAVTAPAWVTVAAGATSVGFKATISAVTKAESATLTATADGVTKSDTIQLGAATPGLTLQSLSVSFGDVTLEAPATQTVLLTSSGTAALTISAATVSGVGFSLVGPGFPVTLQPGQQTLLEIQFDPTATGATAGKVTLTTNTTAGTATITLSGTGAAAAAYEVDLSWDAPTDSAVPVVGYDIYRAVSGSSSYQLLNAHVDDLASYADTTVQSGKSYTYYVVSVDAEGNHSVPSNLFSATVP